MDIVLSAGYLIVGLVGLMLSFYLALCFIQWIGDVVEEKRWRYWR
tara:strand:- start:380 stop:514 length:135 start_codon:yes stop_codon:yes gene_type:complete